jgi:hypothetical protein
MTKEVVNYVCREANLETADSFCRLSENAFYEPYGGSEWSRTLTWRGRRLAADLPVNPDRGIWA